MTTGSVRPKIPSLLPIVPPADRWEPAKVAGKSDLELLAYRSNLLGSDRAVANWGGGNTSSKITEADHRERATRVLWVKGSGSDLGGIRPDQFTGMRLDDLQALGERADVSDDDLVAYYERAAFLPRQPRASIDTPLHSFLPATHVDHTHADAIIALCAVPEGAELARRLWGEAAIWVPYERPSFALGRHVGRAVAERPNATLVLLAKHGLVTWGESHEACYRSTIATIGRAAEALAERCDRGRVFPVGSPPRAADRRQALATVLPALRGAVSTRERRILHLDTSDEATAFASRLDLTRLVDLGPACPDHLIHTRRWPMVMDPPDGAAEDVAAAVRDGVTAYASHYDAYLRRNGLPTGGADTTPRVVLIRGTGIVTIGHDIAAAQLTAALYERARAVLAMTAGLGGFAPLSETESFAVEHWPLERYKLTLRPAPRELDGRIVLVTGGGSGIGRSCSLRLAAAGAHVAVTDINAAGAAEVAAEIETRHGTGRAIAVNLDVTDENAVDRGFGEATLAFGGIDIVVSNAGLATSAPVMKTSVADWDRNQAVLARGSFLVGRAALRLFQTQALGGSIVFIASKNAVVAGRDAAAYSAAKAATLHLARCLAEEGGMLGVRVNVVNPDAVIDGSGIWTGPWREERARAYGIAPDQLEEYYRQRTGLKLSVLPEDVAEAVLFFASDRSSKTTGNFLNVDGGVSAAYPR